MKQLQVGLVVEGNATASVVLRLTSLATELGPIKSSGLQVARRISNFLKAGYGVSDYRDLETANTVLLKLPDEETPRVVAELAETNLPFAGMAFILCESWLPASALHPLRERGASVASLVVSGAVPENCLLLEGDKPAVRKSKRMIERGGLRALELKPDAKALFFAANLMLTAIPIPIFQLCQQALRESGVAGNDLAAILGDWTAILSARAKKGDRINWGGPLTECPPQAAEGYFRTVRERYPLMAVALEEWLTIARRQMGGRARAQTA